MSETLLDAQGLSCPLPVLRARKVLRGLPEGAVLRLLATDPGAVRDVAAMCEATGDRLIGSDEADGIFTFRIEKTAGRIEKTPGSGGKAGRIDENG